MAYYMRDSNKEVKRGDIFYVANSKCYSTDPSIEAGRPGVIVSCDELNAHSNMVEVVYLTTKEKRYMPTHTDVLCKVPSTSICENISTVSKDRLGDFVRTCTDAEIEKINEAMLHSLGISHSVEREVEEAPTDITKLAVEKDLYKNLYEQLLDKLAAR